MVVDEVLDERLRLRDRRLPDRGRLAHDLVGILPVGESRHTDILEVDPGVIRLELSDEPGQGGHPERARLLPRRVDVIGEDDP